MLSCDVSSWSQINSKIRNKGAPSIYLLERWDCRVKNGVIFSNLGEILINRIDASSQTERRFLFKIILINATAEPQIYFIISYHIIRARIMSYEHLVEVCIEMAPSRSAIVLA